MSSTPQEPKQVEQGTSTKEKVVTIGTLIIACAATGILSMIISIYLSNLEKVSSETFIGTIATLIGIIVALAIGFQIYNSLDSKRSIEKLIEQVEKKISNYDIEHKNLKRKISNIDILRNDLKYIMNYIQMNQCDIIIDMMIANEKGKTGHNQAILEALIAGLKYRLIHDNIHIACSKDVQLGKIIYDYEFYLRFIIIEIEVIILDSEINNLKEILEVIPREIKQSKIKEHSSYPNIRISIEKIEDLLERIKGYNYSRNKIDDDIYIQEVFRTTRLYLDND